MKKLYKIPDYFIKKKTKSRAYKAIESNNNNTAKEQEEEEDELEKLKKGLEVHFSVKVIRTTQLPPSENGTKVHILYGHGKDHKKDRAQSAESVIEDRICVWDKEVKPYEFSVVLVDEVQKYSEIQEIDWKPHPIYFSLRKNHILTEKEKEEKRIRDEKLQEKKEKEIEKIEKEMEKRKKKGKSIDDLELKLQEIEEQFSISSDEEEALFYDVIGTKVQLDLVDYCEHESNTMEAFGVPNPKPEKGSDEESSDEDDDKPKPPPTIAYKLVANIQAKWLRYLGRRITNDQSVEGEKVNIHGTEWVYLDPPLTDKPKKAENPNVNKEFLALLGDDKKGKTFTSVLESVSAESSEEKKSKKEEKEEKKKNKKEGKEMKKQQEKLEKEERANRLLKEEEERKKREAEEEELIRQDIEISNHIKRSRELHEEETRLLEKERLRREKEDEKLIKKDINIRNSLRPQKKDKHRRSFSLTSTSDSDESDLVGKKKSPNVYSNDDVRDEFGLFELKKYPSQQSSKRKCKLDFEIYLLSICNLPEKCNGKVLFLSWMRGSNKYGDSARVVCENSLIEFDDSQNKPIQFTCTFIQLPKKSEFEQKMIAFALKEDNAKKSLFSALIDLSTFANSNLDREIELPLSNVKDPPLLVIRIVTKQAYYMEGSTTAAFKNSISFNPLNFTSQPLSVLFSLKLKEFICADRSLIQNDSQLCVHWKRGNKEKNKGTSSPITIRNGRGIWANEPTIQLTCTMLKKSKKSSYQSKKLSIAILTSKQKIIKKLAVNLAEYSEQNFSKEIPFFFKGAGILTVQLNTKWRAIGGKKLIETDAPSDSKPSLQISGVNYQLVTADDISEISEIESEKVETDSDEEIGNENEEIFKELEPDNDSNYTLKFSGPEIQVQLRQMEEKYERLNFKYESFLAENQSLSEEMQFLRSNPDSNALMKRVERQLSKNMKDNEIIKREYSAAQKRIRTKLQKREKKLNKSINTLHATQAELQTLCSQFDSIFKEKQVFISKLSTFSQQVQGFIDPLVKNVKNIGNPEYYKKLQEILDYNSQQNTSIISQIKKFHEANVINKKEVANIEDKVITLSQDIQSLQTLIRLETKTETKHEILLFIHSNIYAVNIIDEPDPRGVASRLFNEVMRRKSPAFLGKIFQSIYAPVKNAGTDRKLISYWLHVAISIYQSILSKCEMDEEMPGIDDHIKAPRSIKDSSQIEEQIDYMKWVIFKIHSAYMNSAYKELNKVVEHSLILGYNAMINDPHAIIDPAQSVLRIVKLLEETLKLFSVYQMPSLVIQQTFHQINYFLSASLVNLVLEHNYYCSYLFALRIKMGISFLDDWIIKTAQKNPHLDLELSCEQFNVIREVTNLLTLANNTNALADMESIYSYFPTLTLFQMRKILSSYQIDKKNKFDKIPEYCLSIIDAEIVSANEEDAITIPTTLSFAKFEETIYAEELEAVNIV